MFKMLLWCLNYMCPCVDNETSSVDSNTDTVDSTTDTVDNSPIHRNTMNESQLYKDLLND